MEEIRLLSKLSILISFIIPGVLNRQISKIQCISQLLFYMEDECHVCRIIG